MPLGISIGLPALIPNNPTKAKIKKTIDSIITHIAKCKRQDKHFVLLARLLVNKYDQNN